MSQIESATIHAPAILKQSKTYPLMECFGPTVQGEGPATGMTTYFLRFGLCDFKCVLCDSMHAVDPLKVRANAMWLTQDEIFTLLEQQHAKNPGTPKRVVISGGNPAIHNLTDLVVKLKNNYWEVHAETQGTVFANWLYYVDQLVISPKGPGMGVNHDFKVIADFMKSVSMNMPTSMAMKVPIFDQRDLEFAAQLVEQYPWFTTLRREFYLSLGNVYPPGYFVEHQPENLAENLLQYYKVLLSDIMHDARLRNVKFTPQLHVLLWGNQQGV